MANHAAKHAKEEARRAETPAPVLTPPANEKSVASAPVIVAETSRSDKVHQGSTGFAAFGSSAFDASEWSKKSLDMWNEQATAMVDFADGLSKAKTYSDIVSLQSRFVSERLDTMMRQSSELFTLAQKMMSLSFAPLGGAKSAR